MPPPVRTLKATCRVAKANSGAQTAWKKTPRQGNNKVMAVVPPSPPKTPIQAETELRTTRKRMQQGKSVGMETPPKSSPAKASAAASPEKAGSPVPATDDGGTSRWNCTNKRVIREVQSALVDDTRVDAPLLCREKESATLDAFLAKAMGRGGALCVCGLPGSGKSFTVSRAIASVAKGVSVAMLNCMAVTEPRDILASALRDWGIAVPDSGGAATAPELLAHVRDAVSARSGRLVLVLDELDHLFRASPAFLVELLAVCERGGTPALTLVGIANALDLMQRLLPRVTARRIDAPQMLSFAPYDKSRLKHLLEQRIATVPGAFDTRSLDLCAMRFAAATGDMRRALQVCRRALEKHVASATSPGAAPAARTKPVDVPSMASALHEALRSPEVDIVRNLPQHGQLALCAFVERLVTGGSVGDPTSSSSSKTTTSHVVGGASCTLDDLRESYARLCALERLPPLAPGEFAHLADTLADQALLVRLTSAAGRLMGCRGTLPGQRGASGRGTERWTLRVTPKDIALALKGIKFYERILDVKCSGSGGVSAGAGANAASKK